MQLEQINGIPVRVGSRVVTSGNTTLSAADHVVVFNGASGAATSTFTVPVANTLPGKEYILSCQQGTINLDGATVTNGASTLTSISASTVYGIKSENARWVVYASAGVGSSVADGSITNAKIAANADISASKINQAELAEYIRDTIAAALTQGTNIVITTSDVNDTITISASGGSGGGFTPITAEYETPGTSTTFQVPSGATRIYARVIAAGSGGGSGRRGSAGTVRGGGAGGQGGGWSETNLTLAGIATALNTTVANLYFSVVVQTGGAGGATVTTDDTNGAAGTTPSGETQLRVQAGTGGTPVVICRAQSAGAGAGGTTAGGAVGFSLIPNSSNTMVMFANAGATAGGTGGGTSGFQSAWTTGIQGGSGGQGINSSNVGAAAIGQSGGTMNAIAGGLIPNTNSATSHNAVAHGIPLLAGNGGIGGSSNGTTSRNGGNGYRGSGGGGGGASENGTASGAGGVGGNGYVGILWS